MSVNVPVFTVTEGESKDLYPYSFASVTSELDSSISSLTELLPKLLKLAEVERRAICLPTRSKRTGAESTRSNTL